MAGTLIPKDHKFLYNANGTRENKVIFMSNYGDKARMQTTLTWTACALSGGVSMFSFPIRIQLNGSFFGVEDMVEHGDDLWLAPHRPRSQRRALQNV